MGRLGLLNLDTSIWRCRLDTRISSEIDLAEFACEGLPEPPMNESPPIRLQTMAVGSLLPSKNGGLD